jgi:hypothetical protein
MAENINCEKIILKQQKMILIFDTKNKITGLQDKTLNNIIDLIRYNQRDTYSIKEENDKIKLYINDINTINSAIKIMREIHV